MASIFSYFGKSVTNQYGVGLSLHRPIYCFKFGEKLRWFRFPEASVLDPTKNRLQSCALIKSYITFRHDLFGSGVEEQRRRGPGMYARSRRVIANIHNYPNIIWGSNKDLQSRKTWKSYRL